MAQPSSKYIKGDQVVHRNASTDKCEVVAVHWNKISSQWQYNILSATGARKVNIRENDINPVEKAKSVAPKEKKAVKKLAPKAEAKSQPKAESKAKPKAKAKKTK